MRAVTLALLVSAHGSALALSSAHPEAILCSSDQVALATVVSAQSDDCRLRHWKCSPEDSIFLKMRVERVLGSRTSSLDPWVPDRLRSGDHAAVRVFAFTTLPGMETGFMTRSNEPISDKDAEIAFLGQTFVLAVRPGVGPPSRWEGTLWPRDRETWATNTLASAANGACPTSE